MELYQQQNYERSLSTCDAAARAAVDNGSRARIERQRGVIQVAMKRYSDAFGTFMRALVLDPDLGPPGRSPAVELFTCARTALGRGYDLSHFDAELRATLDADPTSCPAPPQPVASSTVAPAPNPNPNPPDDREVPLPHPEPPERAESVASEASHLPVWVGGGIAVAAVGAGAVFGAISMSRAGDADRASDPRAAAVAANISWGVAATSAAIAVIFWLVE